MRGAMVAGAGYAAGKSRANHRAQEAEQEQRIAELEAQQAPEPVYEEAAPAPSMEQKAAELTQLKSLLDSGILTQEEFDAQKQSILAG
jgi:membrane protease subunit (stomatin/prohibitin family)